MSSSHVPEPGQTVDELLAVCVGQHRTLARDPDVGLRVERRVMQWVNDVCKVSFAEVGVGRSGRVGHSVGPFGGQNSTRRSRVRSLGFAQDRCYIPDS